MSEKMIVVASSFEDRNNRNNWIPRHLAGAFADLLGDAGVMFATFDSVVRIIATERPSLLILVGSPASLGSDFRDVASACRQVGTCFAFWTVEDPYEADFNFRFEPFADIVFTNDIAAVDYYRREDVHHLPLATTTALKGPVDDYKLRPIDIFFCGVAFPNRQLLINDLQPVLRRHRTTIWGDGWPPCVSAVTDNRRVGFDTLIRAYRTSRVVLNVGRDLSLANARHIKPLTPGPRTFDAAMAGCVQLFYRPGPRLAEYFKPGAELLTFETIREGEELINATLFDPASAIRMAVAAQERAEREHTYIHRARRILDIAGLTLVAEH